MIVAYPGLAMTRALVEAPILENLKKAGAPGAPADLLARVPLPRRDRVQLYAASPALERAARALPGLDAAALSDATIAAWAAGIAEAPTPAERYSLIAFAASAPRNEARRNALRAALEPLAQARGDGIDHVRARVLLAEFDRDDHRPEALRARLGGLLPQAPLDATPERSLSEATLHAMQHAARYFTTYGHIAEAIEAHERIAARYPGTALARLETAEAAELREKGIAITLRRADREARRLHRKSPAQAAAHYRALAGHAATPALAQALRDRANAPNPPPPPKAAAPKTQSAPDFGLLPAPGGAPEVTP